MKKITLLACLLGTSISAQAMQCPPASAFSYDKSEKTWVLNGADKSQWRVSYSPGREGDEDNLNPATKLTAILAGTDNGRYQGMCFYNNGNTVGIYLDSIDVFTVNPKTINNFYPFHHGVDYQCITSAGNNTACQW